MLIGYVSDEYFSALCDVAVELQAAGKTVAIVRSSPCGAIHADVAGGRYKVTLAKDGYGAKHVEIDILSKPHQFRLLSNKLLGYAWPKWVRSGEPAEFKIHSLESCRVSLWRYGYKKEFVQLLGWFDEHAPHPFMQILPDGDFTSSGVAWNKIGYPPKRKGLMATAPAKSGLYFFHAETESGEFFSFPWVVAPAKPTAAIAVLASTNTWNAYNNFGGRSNYIAPEGLRDEPTVNSRQDLPRYTGQQLSVWHSANEDYVPLSFERPEPFNHVPKTTEVTDPIRGRQSCHLAEAEWRLLGWLEREGFGYDFYSDHQLHSGALDLDAYKVLVISTHPEYWSKEAYVRVKKWVCERGGKLMYLGGNGIDCEVEFSDDATMRCKTWLPNPTGALEFIEPSTGKRFDCRFHYTVESPAGLLGVVFDEKGISTAAPYRVSDSSHWIFQDTGLKDGDVFGQRSLHERCPGGASGHETDKRTAGSPKNLKLLATGTNENAGGAEMVYHELKSGGAVFSVGSITWPASLLVDDPVSRMTRNVIERFLR